MNKYFFFEKMIGKKLSSIGHAADMIWIIIEDISVHLQAEAVFYLRGQILAQTSDIYQETGTLGVRGNRPQTSFDVKIEDLFYFQKEFVVLEVTTDSELNLQIAFSGGLVIRTIPDGNLEQDDEKWRIFIKGSNLPHLVAEEGSISWC